MESPSVLLVLTDQQQGRMIGRISSEPLRTPAVNDLMNRGTWFASTYCTTPQCSPSRASLLTGAYAHLSGVEGNIPETRFGPPSLPKAVPSLGQLFGSAGFATAYFGKWHLGDATNPETSPLGVGFDHFHPSVARDEVESEQPLADAAAAYIRDQAPDRPFFMVASFNDPHGVYALEDVDVALDDASSRVPENFHDDLTTKPRAQRIYRDEDQPTGLPRDHETVRRYRAWYRAMVERADGYLGTLLEAVRARDGTQDRTIVIFASDHGDLAFAHGLPYKGPCLYEELVHVPLVIAGPGVPPGRIDRHLVSLVDLLPTLCDLCSLPVPEHTDGRSLRPRLSSIDIQKPTRNEVFFEYRGKQDWEMPIRGIRTDSHKLTVYRTGERELYDLDADPGELVNLAGHREHSDVEDDLLRRLEKWMIETGDTFYQRDVTDRQGNILRPAKDA